MTTSHTMNYDVIKVSEDGTQEILFTAPIGIGVALTRDMSFGPGDRIIIVAEGYKVQLIDLYQ